MDMNNRGRSNKSLCEKSMEMVVNIVKLSSFSIAKMSLGTAGSPPATKNIASFSGSVANTPPLMPQFPVSQRAQEPKSSSMPVSFLIEPNGNGSSSHVIHEEESVDGKATDYIRKVHAKNRNHSSEPSTLSPYILPPPPHVLM